MDRIYYSILAFIIRVLDFVIPKDEKMWGFPVHFIKSDQFIENPRAVFESLKNEENIIKVLFTRDKVVDLGFDYKNIIVVNLYTLRGLGYLLRCKVLFVARSVSMDYSIRYSGSRFVVLKLDLTKRVVVNTWHGVLFKKLFSLSHDKVKERTNRIKYTITERKHYSGLIASSNVDSYAMSAIFHPIEYENIWVTGLPRNDFLVMKEETLPHYLNGQIHKLRTIKGEKKLIVFAPTYRQIDAVSGAYYHQFSLNEINALKALLKKHNAIFGYRFHYFENTKDFFNLEEYLDNEYIFDLGHKKFPELIPIVREADVIISDYSSVFIESIYIDKPVFSFAYDYQSYKNEQDGLLYDFEMVFPGKFATDFTQLLVSVDEEISFPQQILSEKYKFSKTFFYNQIDGKNSQRVIERIKECLIIK